ncbi:hypothetical protein [Natranaerofaba carboxydovora]|uniref:hypothetical protein n=1 Tax=Natranaerofaba carboxydovora TaxID=2742683 RepID=UPI001F142493|nr:hypothetical protein [Natranaerofaba carboxydovora]UMZ74126.1 hypothetical protein ACONDI_01705 [Natranaerofaba carboxydovora]
MSNSDQLPSSFRDPSGQLFTRDKVLYRQINNTYKEHYEKLINSGLYDELVSKNLLIPHKEVDVEPFVPEKAYKTIKPKPISFISYPYEWSFSQLKDAALTTLKIQKIALEHDMILKDASAYNIQFYKNKPVLIDTLSFETYKEGTPWVSYRQFCQHFLSPLALMHYCDIRLVDLFKVHIDGIPLDLASKLLPSSSKLRFSILSHIHLHAKSQKYYSKTKKDPDNSEESSNKSENKVSKKNMSRFSLKGLIDSLESAVKKLGWDPGKTAWSNYYEKETGEEYIEDKKAQVEKMLNSTPTGTIWDIGANTGLFSEIASKNDNNNEVISMDLDPACVEINYLETKDKIDNILPLIVDFTNPSPAIGWDNKERMSIFERGPADTALALALIHHLAIGNNVPFHRLAEFFHRIGKHLIIEFVPKDDVQVKRLLKSREDIFEEYTKEEFEKHFNNYFEIKEMVNISNSKRILYLMEAKPI